MLSQNAIRLLLFALIPLSSFASSWEDDASDVTYVKPFTCRYITYYHTDQIHYIVSHAGRNGVLQSQTYLNEDRALLQFHVINSPGGCRAGIDQFNLCSADYDGPECDDN